MWLSENYNMRDIVIEASRHKLKLWTALIVILVVSSQFLVFLKIRDRLVGNEKSHSNPLFDDDFPGVDEPKASAVKSEVAGDFLSRLPAPEIDEYDFRAEVVRPQQEMIEKFPKHPEMVLKKLEKFVEKEEKK